MTKTIFTVNKGDTLRITYTHSIIKKAIRKDLVCRYGRRDIKEYEEGLFPAKKLPESVLKKAKNILKANPTVYIYMRGCTFSVEKERKPEDVEISFCLLGSYNRRDIFGNELEKEWLTFAKDFPYINETVKKVTVNNGHFYAKRIAIFPRRSREGYRAPEQLGAGITEDLLREMCSDTDAEFCED